MMSCAAASEFTHKVIVEVGKHRIKTCCEINSVMHDMVDIPHGFAVVVSRVEGPCFSIDADLYDDGAVKPAMQYRAFGLRINIDHCEL